MTLHDALASRRLLVVTGKGGVGKSAVAAALATLFAGPRRTTVLLESDPRETQHELLGIPPSGGALVPAGPNLYLQNAEPRRVMDELTAAEIPIEALSRRVLASPVYRHFTDTAPGLKELALLTYAAGLVDAGPGAAQGRRGRGRPTADLVVLDAPATGHGVALLAAPALAAEAVRGGPFARKAEQLTRFVRDPALVAVVVVTRAEEMPVQEALELKDALRERVGLAPAFAVVNALQPPFPQGVDAETDPLLGFWRRRRALNERELRRFVAAWEGPRAELPLLPLERGPELVDELRARIAAALEAPA